MSQSDSFSFVEFKLSSGSFGNQKSPVGPSQPTRHLFSLFNRKKEEIDEYPILADTQNNVVYISKKKDSIQLLNNSQKKNKSKEQELLQKSNKNLSENKKEHLQILSTTTASTTKASTSSSTASSITAHTAVDANTIQVADNTDITSDTSDEKNIIEEKVTIPRNLSFFHDIENKLSDKIQRDVEFSLKPQKKIISTLYQKSYENFPSVDSFDSSLSNSSIKLNEISFESKNKNQIHSFLNDDAQANYRQRSFSVIDSRQRMSIKPLQRQSTETGFHSKRENLSLLNNHLKNLNQDQERKRSNSSGQSSSLVSYSPRTPVDNMEDSSNKFSEKVIFKNADIQSTPSSHLQNRKKVNDKKFWMPDKSVNKCYDCQALFTVFKRKHHCRICGQIFCWKCSNNFIEGSEFNHTGRIRVCSLCLTVIQKESTYIHKEENSTKDSQLLTDTKQETSSSSISVQNNQPVENVSNQDTTNTNSSNSQDENSTSDEDDEDIKEKFDNKEKNISKKEDWAESNGYESRSKSFSSSISNIPFNSDLPNTFEFNSVKVTPTVPRDLPSNFTSEYLNESPIDILQSPQMNTDGEILFSPLPNSYEGNISIPRDTISQMDLALIRSERHDKRSINENTSDFQIENVNYISDKEVHYLDKDESFNNEGNQMDISYEMRNRSIISNAQDHLRSLIEKMLKDEHVQHFEEWLSILTNTAWKVVTSIKLNNTDEMDIRKYINLKSILTKSKASDKEPVRKAEFLNGVVFRGNIAHRNMRTNLTNPSILLIESPIQFYRHSTRMISFDILFQQEFDYLTLLVEKISIQKPDLVIVHKSVNRVVQEQLLSRGISLICNVKMSVMQRISRSSGIKILKSVDELELAATRGQLSDENPEHRFIQETFSIPIDYKNGRTNSLFVLLSRRKDSGTVILSSNQEYILPTLKKILRFAIFAAYNLRLEAALCVDSLGEFPIDTIESEDSISKHSTLSEVSSFEQLRNYDFNDDWRENPNCGPIKKIPFISISMNTTIPLYLDDIQNKEQQLDETSFSSPYDSQRIVLHYTKIKKLESFNGNQKMKEQNDSSIDSLYIAPETIVIDYYSSNDMTLGQYLMTKCFTEDALEESLQYAHAYTHCNSKLIVEVEGSKHCFTLPGTNNDVIMMWSFCRKCNQFATPLVPMTTKSFNYSFAKFLEICFYDNQLRCTGHCNHRINRDHVRYFGFRGIVARFFILPVLVYEMIFPPSSIQLDNEALAHSFNNLCGKALERCEDLFRVYNNTLFNSEDFPFEAKDYLMQSQKKLMEDLKGRVIPSKDIYLLNRFFQNLYHFTKEWNALIHSNTSKGDKKNHSNIVSNMFSSSAKKTYHQNSSSLDLNYGASRIEVKLHCETNEDDIQRIRVEIIEAGMSSTGKKFQIPTNCDIQACQLQISQNKLDIDILIYENEPSSVVAFTLHSKEYQNSLNQHSKPSTLFERLLIKDKFHIKHESGKAKKITSKFDEKLKIDVSGEFDDNEEGIHGEKHYVEESDSGESLPTKKQKIHVSCTSFFSLQFHALRELCNENEDQFIRSLSRSNEWKPTGGKSGSLFTKSWDNRYIIKHIPRIELNSFLENALAYFEYMGNILTDTEDGKSQTALTKFFGVYKLSIQIGKKVMKHNVIVMENLFYNAHIDHIFDLKGSLRNRYQKVADAVKMDENMLREMQFGNEIITRNSDKNHLTISIFNDTFFLSQLNVMDYSLLVGIDEKNRKLYVGIIDYVRQYTWDKQFETIIKSTTFAKKKKAPTVINPKLYKTRFREAAIRYFPSMKTHFSIYKEDLPRYP